MKVLKEDADDRFLAELTKLCTKYQVVLNDAKVFTGNLRYVRYDSVQRSSSKDYGELIVDYEFE